VKLERVVLQRVIDAEVVRRSDLYDLEAVQGAAGIVARLVAVERGVGDLTEEG
jgi:hypothetical protein